MIFRGYKSILQSSAEGERLINLHFEILISTLHLWSFSNKNLHNYFNLHVCPSVWRPSSVSNISVTYQIINSIGLSNAMLQLGWIFPQSENFLVQLGPWATGTSARAQKLSLSDNRIWCIITPKLQEPNHYNWIDKDML